MYSGLIYHPGVFADRDELSATAQIVGTIDGIYTTHLRSAGKYLNKAIDVALSVAENSGTSVEISNLKCVVPAN